MRKPSIGKIQQSALKAQFVNRFGPEEDVYGWDVLDAQPWKPSDSDDEDAEDADIYMERGISEELANDGISSREAAFMVGLLSDFG
jgi:hypothetical protein